MQENSIESTLTEASNIIWNASRMKENWLILSSRTNVWLNRRICVTHTLKSFVDEHNFGYIRKIKIK